MNVASRPVRLIPQTAQPIDSHARCAARSTRHISSAARLKVYRCGSCGLTITNLLAPGSPADDNAAANKPKRTEEQHKALISQLPDNIRTGPVLLLADPHDSIVRLLQQMPRPSCSVFRCSMETRRD